MGRGERVSKQGTRGRKRPISHHETPQMRGDPKGKANPHLVLQAFLPALFLMNEVEQHMQVEARTMSTDWF